MDWAYINRKHWELRVGRLVLQRWHRGAPCHLRHGNRQPHPITVIRVRHSQVAR